MPTVGSLAWQLIANNMFGAGTRGAIKDTKLLRAELVSLSGVGASLTTVMGGLGIAIGGAAIVNGIREMTAESMEAIDATATLSDRLGVSTEMLTGLGHAAQMNGSSAEELNDSLDTISKTIGGLNERGGKNVQVLAQMGVDVAKLSAMSPDQMFLELADAMQMLGTAQERAALAGMLKIGPEMVNVLMQGRDALEDNVREADALGIAYSRIEAEKIKKANDAWAQAQASVKGVANEIAFSLTPAVEAYAAALHDAINIGKIIRGEQGFGDLFKRQLNKDKLSLPNESERLKLLQQMVNQGKITPEQAQRAGLDIKSTAQVAAEEETEKLNESMQEFIDNLGLQVATYGMASDAAQLYEMRMRGATQADIEAAQALIDQKTKLDEAKKLEDQTAKDNAARANEQKSLMESLKTPAERFNDEFGNIIDMLGPEGFANPDLFRRAMEDLQDRVKGELGPGATPAVAQSTAGIRAGSIEALRAQFSGNIPQKQLKEAEKQTREQEAMRLLLESIEGKLQPFAEAPG